jgi:hypothetical protein
MQSAIMNVAAMSPELQIRAKTITTAPIEFHKGLDLQNGSRERA